MGTWYWAYNLTTRQKCYLGKTVFDDAGFKEFLEEMGWAATDKIEIRGDDGSVLRYGSDESQADDVTEKEFAAWTNLVHDPDHAE